MRLGNMVGSRINIFDNLEVQTVETFNNLFPECPIKNEKPDTRVSIESPMENNCRMLFVGDKVLTHKMYSDILYTIDKDERNEEEEELFEINGVPV